MSHNPLLTPAEQAHIDAVRAAPAHPVDYLDNSPTPQRRIDWYAITAFIPWFVTIAAFAMWAAFLLIPTAFGLHYTGMFPAMSNWSYVAMGLTLCIAAYRASKAEHGLHAILFTFGVLLLAYWF